MQAWRAELKRHLLILAAVSLAGFTTGKLVLAWLLLFVSYAVFNFYQLLRLTKWLAKDHSSNKSPPPESFGLWGGILMASIASRNRSDVPVPISKT